ncbi:hypothetical protein IPM09_03475 [Candidatus Saccharibacteria bacterium]|nr:MAG: hypothetical protein IPM09_03475 [Candidatus Saccharibacteria bacterium]
MSERAPTSTVAPEITPPPEQPAAETVETTSDDLPELKTEAELHDEANRFTDAEILGKSFRVRRLVHETTTETLNGFKAAKADMANMLSTPKNNYLRRRYEAAEDKYQRKLAKVGTSRFKFMNNHYKNAASRAGSKRNERYSRYNSHTGKMEGRVEAAKDYAKRNKELMEKKIEAYKTIKSVAEGRKELRKMRRDLRREGLNHAEVNKRLGLEKRPDESMEDYAQRRAAFQKRVGRLVCARETVGRESRQVEQQARRERAKKAKIDRQLTETIELAEHNKSALEKASRSLEQAEHHSTRTHEMVEELQAELGHIDGDDPRRTTLEDKLARAKQTWERYAVRKEQLKQEQARLVAEASRLTRSIERQTRAAREQAYQASAADRVSARHASGSEDLRHRINEEDAAIYNNINPTERNE